MHFTPMALMDLQSGRYGTTSPREPIVKITIEVLAGGGKVERDSFIGNGVGRMTRHAMRRVAKSERMALRGYLGCSDN